MTTGLFQKYNNTLCSPSKILHKLCYQFLLELTITPRKIENNTAAKFWRDKKEYVTFEKGLWQLACGLMFPYLLSTVIGHQTTIILNDIQVFMVLRV